MLEVDGGGSGWLGGGGVWESAEEDDGWGFDGVIGMVGFMTSALLEKKGGEKAWGVDAGLKSICSERVKRVAVSSPRQEIQEVFHRVYIRRENW